MLIKKYALNKHVHLLTRLYGIRAESNKQEMTSYLINFLSYLLTLLHSAGVPLNKKLIWRGLSYKSVCD